MLNKLLGRSINIFGVRDNDTRALSALMHVAGIEGYETRWIERENGHWIVVVETAWDNVLASYRFENYLKKMRKWDYSITKNVRLVSEMI